MWFVIYVSKKSCRPWERPGSLSLCQAMLGPFFSDWAPSPKYVPTMWLLFHPSVCWLTQAIILTSGLCPNSLRHLMALILPLEASPPELCASAFFPPSYLTLCYSFLSSFPCLLHCFHTATPVWVLWWPNWEMNVVVMKPNITQIKNCINSECPPSFPFLLPLLMSG